MLTESLSYMKPLSVFSERFLKSLSTFQSPSVIISKILKFNRYSFVQENVKENYSIFWTTGVYIFDIYHVYIKSLCGRLEGGRPLSPLRMQSLRETKKQCHLTPKDETTEAQEGARPWQSQNGMQGAGLSYSDPKTPLWVSWAPSQLEKPLPNFSQCKVLHSSPLLIGMVGILPLYPHPLQRSCHSRGAPDLQGLSSWCSQKTLSNSWSWNPDAPCQAVRAPFPGIKSLSHLPPKWGRPLPLECKPTLRIQQSPALAWLFGGMTGG